MEEGMELPAEIHRMLDEPDALARVPKMQWEYGRRQHATETQLTAAVQSQVEDATAGMQLLAKCFDEVAQIEASFQTLDGLWKQCAELVQQTPMIKTLSVTRQNVARTRVDVEMAVSVTDEVEEIQVALLDEENLVPAHKRVAALERKRNELLFAARHSPKDLEMLRSQFLDVDTLAHELGAKLWGIIHNVLHVAVNDPATLVKVLRVVEREERIDQKAAAAEREAKIDNDDTKLAAFYLRKPKNYRDRCMEHLTLAVESRFGHMFDECEGMDDILSSAEHLLSDLSMILDDIVPCFPPHYLIFDFFVREYHKRLYLKISTCTQSQDLEAAEILSLVTWVSNYHMQLENLGAKDAEPRLTEAIDPLLRQYIVYIRNLMTQWVHNLVVAERRDDVEPEQQGDGTFYTLAPIDLFKIFDQQVLLAKDVSRGRLLRDVVQECVNMLHNFIQLIMNALNEDWTEMSLERLCAAVNNFNRCMDLTEVFAEKMAEELDPEYRDDIDFEDVTVGFVKAGKAATSVVANYIFRDVQQYINQFFTKAWLVQGEGDPVAVVCATVTDYLEDLQVGLTETYCKKLTLELLERTVHYYMEPLLLRREKLNEDALDKMEADHKTIWNAFGPFMKRREKILLKHCNQINTVCDFLDADEEWITTYIRKLRDTYPDVGLNVLEALFMLHPEMDKKAVKANMAEAQKLYDEMPPMLNADPDKWSIFTKILPPPMTEEKPSKQTKADKKKDKEDAPKKQKKGWSAVKERLMAGRSKKKNKNNNSNNSSGNGGDESSAPMTAMLSPLATQERRASVAVATISLDDL